MADDLFNTRPATAEEKDEIARKVTGGIQGLFNLTTDLLFDRPAFVAGDDEQNFLGAATRALTRYNCRRWARSDQSQNSARVNIGNYEICGPYLESIGEVPPPGFIGPAFDGGQCATAYAVSYETQQYQRTNPTNSGDWVVRTAFINQPSPMLGPIRLESNAFGAVRFRDANNVLMSMNFGGSNGFNPNGFFVFRYRNLTFTRVDGLPDNCGDPEPQTKLPNAPTGLPPLPPNITIDVPGFGPVTVTIEPGPDGDPVICVEEVQVCVEVDQDDEPAPPGQPPSVPPPGDVGEPGGGGDTGPGGDSEGEAPPGSVLTGLLMELLEAPESAREYAPGIYRAGAYIYMGTDVGLDQDFAGSLLEDGQFVFAEKDNLTSWRVRANVGFNWRVTPYYREVSE